MTRLLSFLTLIACLIAPPVLAGRVTVFAAASLKTALDDLSAPFEAASGHDVVISYAGSSALARQIQQGAPADVFLSANTDWMDVLQDEGLLIPGSRITLLGNTLVLIAPAPHDPVTLDDNLDLPALLNGGRLAMALVNAVPAGIYGKAALTSLGLWGNAAPHVAQADNVRAALALVALGEAPLGIVYATDAAAEPGVAVLGTFPKDSHAAIRYPAAQIDGRDSAAARAYMAFLQGPTARDSFQRHGFSVLSD